MPFLVNARLTIHEVFDALVHHRAGLRRARKTAHIICNGADISVIAPLDASSRRVLAVVLVADLSGTRSGRPQKTRIVERRSREHSTDQSSWPARANSPRMTFVCVGPPTPIPATWGIAQPRDSSVRVIDCGSCFREERLNVGV